MTSLLHFEGDDNDRDLAMKDAGTSATMAMMILIANGNFSFALS